MPTGFDRLVRLLLCGKNRHENDRRGEVVLSRRVIMVGHRLVIALVLVGSTAIVTVCYSQLRAGVLRSSACFHHLTGTLGGSTCGVCVCVF